MSTSALIAGCTVVTAVIKAAGPVALGGRDLPEWFTRVIVLLAPALLAALVATAALADGHDLALGPRPRAWRRPAWLSGGRAPSSPAWLSRPR